jgi:hypothetical protein
MACDTPWTTVAVIRTLVEHGAKTAASRQIGPPDYTTVDYTDVGAFVAWASGPDAPRHRAEADKRTIIALLAAAYNCPHYETGILHRPMAMRNAFGEYAGPSFVKITDERGNTRKCERTPAAIARAEGDNDLAHWIENCNPFAELEHTGLLAPLLATAPIAFAPLNAARRGPSPLAAQAARPWAPPRHRLFCTAHRNMARATLTALVYRHNIPNVVAFLIIALVGRDAYIA